jgi:hypothetical protein
MYKRIDFTQLEGLPLTQNTLNFLQESYRDEFAAFAGWAGDYVILSGVADLGANWGDGWVCIAGELLPFVGGVKAAQVVIEETVVAKVYGDGSSKDAWYTRVAKSGVAGGVLHTAFTRVRTLKQIHTDIDLKANLALSAWVTLPLTAPWVQQNGTTDYRKDNFGRVQLRGNVWTNGTVLGSGTLKIGELPAGFRPVQDHSFAVDYYNGTARILNSVRVEPDGEIFFANHYSAYASGLYLDTISFFTD